MIDFVAIFFQKMYIYIYYYTSLFIHYIIENPTMVVKKIYDYYVSLVNRGMSSI